jgi:single-stranded-DNA-specific exonuclease
VIVVGFDGDRGRGSVRGPAGSRLHDLLQASADALVRFGGHQAAAGVEVERDKLAALRELFEAAAGAAQASGGDSARKADEPATLLVDGDDPSRVLDDLTRFEPCGEKNPAPRIAVEARLASAREVRGGHLKLELELPGGFRLSAFGAGMGGRASELTGRITVLGELRWDRYRGGSAVELRADGLG